MSFGGKFLAPNSYVKDVLSSGSFTRKETNSTMNSQFWINRILIVTFFTLLSITKAQAARVAPMVVELDEYGQGAITRVEMTNNENRSLPLEARIFRGNVSEHGGLTLLPADEDFMVFPPQTVIQPLGQQVFRVQYLGGTPLSQSEVYYLSLKEIPIQLDESISRVQIIMNFNVLVNVVPEGAFADPVVDWVKTSSGEEKHSIKVRIANDGTRFFPAGRNPWKISGTDNEGKKHTYYLSADEAGATIGYGLVPAGGARVFDLPTQAALLEETITVELGL